MHLNIDGKLPKYPSSVFGFVSDGGVNKAVQEVCRLRNNYDWVYETDIESFFDTIDRQRLFQSIKLLLPRSSLLPLFEKLIHTEISDRYDISLADFELTRGKGLRQGMPLSPLLSNIALRKFDRSLEKLGICSIRYVDDLVCFAKTKEEALAIHEVVKNLLADEGLKIPEIEMNTKTHVVHQEQPLDFLGWSIRRHSESNSFKKYVSKKKISSIAERLKEYANVTKEMGKKRDLTGTLSALNSSANSYRATYKNAQNFDSVIGAINQVIAETKRNILINLFGQTAVDALTVQQLNYIGLNSSTKELDFII